MHPHLSGLSGAAQAPRRYRVGAEKINPALPSTAERRLCSAGSSYQALETGLQKETLFTLPEPEIARCVVRPHDHSVGGLLGHGANRARSLFVYKRQGRLNNAPICARFFSKDEKSLLIKYAPCRRKLPIRKNGQSSAERSKARSSSPQKRES